MPFLLTQRLPEAGWSGCERYATDSPFGMIYATRGSVRNEVF